MEEGAEQTLFCSQVLEGACERLSDGFRLVNAPENSLNPLQFILPTCTVLYTACVLCLSEFVQTLLNDWSLFLVGV